MVKHFGRNASEGSLHNKMLQKNIVALWLQN